MTTMSATESKTCSGETKREDDGGYYGQSITVLCVRAHTQVKINKFWGNEMTDTTGMSDRMRQGVSP